MGTKNNKRSAFTLIELLIVVSVIALLALLAVNAYTRQIAKGNDARRKADLNRIGVAAEEYEKDNNCYPTTIVCGDDPTQQIYPYLRTVPCDPVTKLKYEYEPGPGNCPSWYRIYTTLQYTADAAVTPGIGPNHTNNFYQSSPNAPALSVSPPSGSGIVSGTETGYWAVVGGSCQPIILNVQGRPACQPAYTDQNCTNADFSRDCAVVPLN